MDIYFLSIFAGIPLMFIGMGIYVIREVLKDVKE